MANSKKKARKNSLETSLSSSSSPSSPSPPPSSSRPRFLLRSDTVESNGEEIYCVSFSGRVNRYGEELVAICGRQSVSIYRCKNDGRLWFRTGFGHCDDDDEENYTCAWAMLDGSSVVVVAGKSGRIRLMDAAKIMCAKTLSGHKRAVCDLKIHPRLPDVLLSASLDSRLLLWNIRSGRVICELLWHTAPVLSCQFSPGGSLVASGGFDCSINVGYLDYSMLSQLSESSRQPWFKAPQITESSLHSNPQEHSDFVDCVGWLGDLFVISKDESQRFIIWQVRCDGDGDDEKEILKFHVFGRGAGEENYWMKFAMSLEYLVCGTGTGLVRVWEWARIMEEDYEPLVLGYDEEGEESHVRQCAISSVQKDKIISVSVNGTVRRWDEVGRRPASV